MILSMFVQELIDVVALIQWARDQIEIFGKAFKRQLFSSDVNPQIVEEAVQLTRAQSKRVGLFHSYESDSN